MGQGNTIYIMIKKGNNIFLIYKEIQKGTVEKSYVTYGLLIFD